MDVVCGHCETHNAAHARYCAQCGQPLVTVAERSDPYVGRTLAGRFDVIRPIGEGAMGRVYLAEQRLGTAARPVALKILRADIAGDPSTVARFHRECQLLVSLSHPNTIRVYDFGELDDDSLFIVTEYVDGRSLGDVIAEEGALPSDRVELLVAQIAGALAEAHERGIVHRDLKPENIMITDEPSPDFVKVLDFGIAKRMVGLPDQARVTARGTVLGTPAYMSPEQFTGQALDAASDVYSLGVVTYEMLTGDLPFHADTPGEWAAKHFSATPAPFEAHPSGPRIPERHRRAVLHALAKAPEQRPDDVWAFVTDLMGTDPRTPRASVMPTRTAENTTAGTTAAALEGPPSEGIRLPTRRGLRAALAGLAGVTVLVAIGVGTTLWRGEGAASPTAAGGETGAADAGPEDGAIETPEETGWFRSVHHVSNASHAQHTLGPQDDQPAVLRSPSTLTLELGTDEHFVGDGTPEPDVRVVASGGPYRVDISPDHHRFLVVDPRAEGTAEIDIDHAVATDEPMRFLRMRNRSGNPVEVDAVRALHLREAQAAPTATGH